MVESDGLPEQSVPGGFELMYREDYAAVVGLIYGLTGSRWVAEDLTQEAFLRAHRDWARIETMASPGGWVRRVALNLARSRWRRLRTRRTAMLRFEVKTQADEAESMPSESEAFWDEVRRLPSRQAQAIALRYVEDLSIAEIANVLAVAEGTVKALLHQGRERLRRELAAKGLLNEICGIGVSRRASSSRGRRRSRKTGIRSALGVT
jgi:RNA polymerase sigma-70 factor (ECF subfamily)